MLCFSYMRQQDYVGIIDTISDIRVLIMFIGTWFDMYIKSQWC